MKNVGSLDDESKFIKKTHRRAHVDFLILELYKALLNLDDTEWTDNDADIGINLSVSPIVGKALSKQRIEADNPMFNHVTIKGE